LTKACTRRWTLDSPTMKPNHPPTVVVNGHDEIEPLYITAHRGETLTLDATKSWDIDGDALQYEWFQYKEAEALLPVRSVNLRITPICHVSPQSLMGYISSLQGSIRRSNTRLPRHGKSSGTQGHDAGANQVHGRLRNRQRA
jgi:hypothetical protein